MARLIIMLTSTSVLAGRTSRNQTSPLRIRALADGTLVDADYLILRDLQLDTRSLNDFRDLLQRKAIRRETPAAWIDVRSGMAALPGEQPWGSRCAPWLEAPSPSTIRPTISTPPR